jgi:tetratricopeptide (TPR) repeat protein
MDEQQRIEAAIEEARSGSALIALVELEDLVRQGNRPQVMGWLGYCLARQKKDFSRALVLCTSALDAQPDNADLYLALGRVYHLAGRRYQALSTLRKGLKMGRNELIAEELILMGMRKGPVFRFLDRNHQINVMAGRVMTRFGSR